MDSKLLIDELLKYLDKTIEKHESLNLGERCKDKGLLFQATTAKVMKKAVIDLMSEESMSDEKKAKEIALRLYTGLVCSQSELFPNGVKAEEKKKKISKALRNRSYETDSKQSRYNKKMDALVKTGLSIDQAHPLATLQTEGLAKGYARECKRRYKALGE